MLAGKDHWESIYRSKSEAELSWTQPEPGLSLGWIADVGPAGRVIDIGGGMSHLSERLSERGYSAAIMDISETAIQKARARAGAQADRIRWFTADVTASPEIGTFDVWHDRAVFHFLTEPAERKAY